MSLTATEVVAFVRRFQGDVEGALPHFLRVASARREGTVVLLGPASRLAPALVALGLSEDLRAGRAAEARGLPVFLALPRARAHEALVRCGAPHYENELAQDAAPGLLRVVVLLEGGTMMAYLTPPTGTSRRDS